MRWLLPLLLCCALPAQELWVEVISDAEYVTFGHSFSLFVKIGWQDGWQLEPLRAEQFAPLKVRELRSDFHGKTGSNERRYLIEVDEEVYGPLAVKDGVVYIHTQDLTLHRVNAESGAVLRPISLESPD